MWLIQVETKILEEFFGRGIPPYAILSHTWDTGQEVTFQEMKSAAGKFPQPESSKDGWSKIDKTCRQAALDGIKYAWVDTCCIDKSSSADLSEAINSMFRWYQRAKVCYVFLQDLAFDPTILESSPWTLKDSIKHCRWFTRSWTLQELIAPLHIKFYDSSWQFCFTKTDVSTVLARITGIDVNILEHTKDLSAVSVAQKMSWAAMRESTRIEDAAYSLLGMFGINMPMLYGEEEKAFLRLQTEIISSYPDLSILAWTHPQEDLDNDSTDTVESLSGVIAESPLFFRDCGEYESLLDLSSVDFSMSNRGIKLNAPFHLHNFHRGTILVLPVFRIRDMLFGVQMRNLGMGFFARQNPSAVVLVPRHQDRHFVLDPILLTNFSLKETKTLILSSRQRVLDIALEPGMDIYRRWPWQRWDEQDTLFFSSINAPMNDGGWAAIKIVASPTHGDFREFSQAEITFLCYVFGWHRNPDCNNAPRCTLYKFHGSTDDRSIEQMNQEAVKERWGAYWVYNRLRQHMVPEQSVLVAATHGDRSLVLTSSVDLVVDNSVCDNPFWRVKFDWKTVLSVESPAVDHGWKSMDWSGS